MNSVMYLTAALFALAVLWKLYQLYQAPQDRALRAVTLCIACSASSFSLGLQAEARLLNTTVGRGTASLVSNVLLLTAVYWLLAFYLHSAADRRKATRRARREAVPLVATLAVITLATIATPANVRGRPFGTADLHTTGVAVFFITAQLYLVYALATTAWWTGRYARISQRPSTIGLWLTAASLASMAVANAIRVTMDAVMWHGDALPAALNQSVALLFALAVPAFVVGVSYPGIAMRLAGLRVWRQHRHVYRRLRPLWLMLHKAFPQDSLHRAPGGTWREVLRVRGVHRGYYRRVIECRDGLLRVSPHLALLGVPAGASPREVARQLKAALRAQAADDGKTAQAFAIALPREDSLDADARQLVAVADALGDTR